MNRNIQQQVAPERGVDIRMPSSALLGVSSSDRYATNNDRAFVGTSPFEVLLTSKQNFLSGFFTRVALTEVRIPWYMQTITARNNKIGLNYRVGGVGPVILYTITINAGWYTPTTLAAELQRAIRAPIVNGGANLPGFTCVYNVVPNPYIFLAGSNNTDTFNFVPVDANQNLPNATGLYEMMNWAFNNLATLQGSGIPTMLSTEFIDIACANLTYAQDVKDGDTGNLSHDLLARIYLAKDGVDTSPSDLGSAPFLIYRQFQTPKQIKWDKNLPIGQLQFQLYDDKGNIINSGFNPVVGYDETLGDWSITLLVSEV